jgi:hypothetical protein
VFTARHQGVSLFSPFDPLGANLAVVQRLIGS